MTDRRCKTCRHDATAPNEEPCKTCFTQDMEAQGIPCCEGVVIGRAATFTPGEFAMRHFPLWEHADGYVADAGFSIIFHVQPYDDEHPPIIELRANGEILVRGKVIDNDKQLVDAMRDFIHAMRARSERCLP